MAKKKSKKKASEEPIIETFMPEYPTHADRAAHALFAFLLAYLLFGMDWLAIATAIAFALIPDLDLYFGHRAVLHNLFAATLIPLIICYFLPLPIKAALLGYYSHIILDCLSPTGVALIWPFSRVHLSLPPFNIFIRSGKRTLLFVIILFILVMIVTGRYVDLI